MTSIRQDLRPFAFLAIATGIYALYWSQRSLLVSLDRGAVLSLALILDLALFIPALFYILLIRPRGWPPGSVLPSVTLGLIASHVLVPAPHRASLHLLKAIPLVVEGAALTWIANRVAGAGRRFRERGVRGGSVDVLGVCQEATRTVLGRSRASDAVAYELALLYYAVASWHRPPSSSGSHRFTCYQRCGYSSLVLGLGLVMVCETIVVHLVLDSLWSATAAWVATGLGVYGMLWFFGDWQALRRRPLELTPNALELRVGLRWDLTIPYARVSELRRLSGFSHPPLPKSEGVDVALFGTPSFEIVLAEPVAARGIYGLRREVTRVRFQVDDPEPFTSRLRELCSEQGAGPPLVD